MKLWTKAFVLSAAENAITTGLSTFAGALVITTTPTWKDVVAAATSAGIAIVWTFAKNLGAVQTATAAKASVPPVA